MKTEADFQTAFSKYNSIKKIIGNFELKDALGKKSLSYNSFEEQQIPSLLAAQDEGYRVKYSDADMRLKPFDYSSNPPIPGWIGICFNRTAYLIHVNVFVRHRDRSKRESITEEECAKICERVVQF